jgi:hypothetical protein
LQKRIRQNILKEIKRKYIAVTAAFIANAGAVTITVGNEGFNQPGNNWPGGENPTFAIDGFGQKYLSFGKFNTGVVVTQASGAQAATSITIWAANDAPGRDPATYQVLGTNATITATNPGDTFDSSLFTVVSEGPVTLAGVAGTNDNRNLGGTTQPLGSELWNVSFANTDTYSSYMILFPTIKDAGQNSMQISEVQLFDTGNAGIFAPGDSILGVQSATTIPEPGSSLLALLGAGLLIRRRRN